VAFLLHVSAALSVALQYSNAGIVARGSRLCHLGSNYFWKLLKASPRLMLSLEEKLGILLPACVSSGVGLLLQSLEDSSHGSLRDTRCSPGSGVRKGWSKWRAAAGRAAGAATARLHVHVSWHEPVDVEQEQLGVH